MKKIVSLLLGFILIFSITTPVFAVDSQENTSINDIYQDAYEYCKNSPEKTITDDYSAYTYLLKHIRQVSTSNNQISISNINISNDETLILNDFIRRLNILLEKGAIKIDYNLSISKKDAPKAVESMPLAPIFELLDQCRTHARELKKVFDNAIFGSAHIIAGDYFAERVKSGGIWDYKDFLGTNNTYYEPELGAIMTGETIGNFHYGYVGRAVFEPWTLKSAAGFIQLISDTSDLSYWDSYWDDPRDTKDIEWGISVYDREH